MTRQHDIYLLAFYHMRPRAGVNTRVKGWMHDLNNITYDESVEITRGKRKQIARAKVVLNLSKKTVDYNGWGTQRKFDEYFKHFFKGYHQYITAVMSQLDIEYFNRMLDEMQAELDTEETAKVIKTE
jgi:hypothetical protein